MFHFIFIFLGMLQQARSQPELSLKGVTNYRLQNIEVQLNTEKNSRETQLVQFKGQYVIRANGRPPIAEKSRHRATCSPDELGQNASAPPLVATPLHCRPPNEGLPNEVGMEGVSTAARRTRPSPLKLEAEPIIVHPSSTYRYPTP
jgi:hypothetical protein